MQKANHAERFVLCSQTVNSPILYPKRWEKIKLLWHYVDKIFPDGDSDAVYKDAFILLSCISNHMLHQEGEEHLFSK